MGPLSFNFHLGLWTPVRDPCPSPQGQGRVLAQNNRVHCFQWYLTPLERDVEKTLDSRGICSRGWLPALAGHHPKGPCVHMWSRHHTGVEENHSGESHLLGRRLSCSLWAASTSRAACVLETQHALFQRTQEETQCLSRPCRLVLTGWWPGEQGLLLFP